MRKKVVSPEHRRAMAKEAIAAKMCSGRAACRFLKLSRSTWRYRRREPTPEEERLVERLKALSEKHPRYGYRRIAALLRREGCSVGRRHVQKLRRAQGVRVPPTKRKIVRRGRSTGLPSELVPYQVTVAWTPNFMAYPVTPELHPDILPFIASLVKFQSDRVSTHIKKIGNGMLIKGKTYEPYHRYTLGVDFP